MFLVFIERCRYRESVQFELPRPNLIIDPRPNNEDIYLRHCRFECSYQYHNNRTTITLTRMDDDGKRHKSFELRVYDPATELVPDFNSTTYTYLGVPGERAPLDTTTLYIHPSVTIIRYEAFWLCDRIQKCIMYDGVVAIEDKAFYFCSDMKFVRLSRSLKTIGKGAFFSCTSLDALFLPPSIEKIEDNAFIDCRRIRILPLPLDMSISKIGRRILCDCHTFFETTQIQRYQYQHQHQNQNQGQQQQRRLEGYNSDGYSYNINNDDEVHQSVLVFYRNLPKLHKICINTNVTAQAINDCIATMGPAVASITDHNRMTPLHILAINPHANSGALLACFHANVCAIFLLDSRHKTPLDYLMEYHTIDEHTSLMAALCVGIT